MYYRITENKHVLIYPNINVLNDNNTYFGSSGASLLSLQEAAKRAIAACSELRSPCTAC